MQYRRVVSILALSSAALLALGGCKRGDQPAEQPAAEAAEAQLVTVRAGQAKEVTADETLAATGSIFAGTDVSIAAKIPGKVIYVGADDGQAVAAGRVLVRLDSRAAAAELERARGGLASAVAALNKARLYQRVVEVDAQAAVRSAQAALEAARARLSQAIESEKIARTKSGDEGVDIAQAEANVRQATARLAQARESLRITERKVVSDVESAEAAVAQAEAAQRQAEAGLAKAETARQLADASTRTAVENARQAVASARNHLAILETGARAQERTQAESQVAAARAAQQTAQIEFDRAKFLFESGAVAKAQFDNAKLMLDTRSEQLRQAEQQLSLVREGPRSEEVNIARAQLAQAEQQLSLAEESRARELALRDQDVAAAKQEAERARQGLAQAQAAQRTAQAARGQRDIGEQEVAQAEQALAQAEQALRLAQAGVGQAEIARQEVAAARTGVETAEQNLRRAQSNLVQPSINREDIANLEGAVRAARAAVAAAAVHYGDHQIVSPLTGSVADKKVEVGEVVNPGQTLFRLVSDQFVHFQALVPEEKVRFVSVAMPVEVRVDAVPGQVFEGRVLEILPAADLRSRTFTVKIGVDNSARKLREGMFARGLIVVQRNRTTLRVPSDAVVQRGDKTYVVRLDAGDVATPVEVEVGESRGGTTELVGGGIVAGDRVVVEGAEQIAAQQKVKVLAESDARGAPPEATR